MSDTTSQKTSISTLSLPATKWLIIVILIKATLLSLIQESELGTLLRYHLEVKTLVQLRHRLGILPPVKESLKVVGIDDLAAATLQRDDLSLDDWAKVFQVIDQYQPRAILIDKLFDRPLKSAEGDTLRQTILELGAPVYSGAFFQQRPIVGRKHVTMFSTEQGDLWFYASDPAFHGVLNFGHIVYQGRGLVRPALKSLDNDNMAGIYHLALAPFQDTLDDSSTWSFDTDELLRVNQRHPDDFKINTINMLEVLDDIHNKETTLPVNAGDVVLILPALYSHTSDYVDSPIGKIHGGYVVASLVDSVLRERWIKRTSHNYILVFILATFGILSYLLPPTRYRWIVLSAMPVGFTLTWTLSFLMFSIETPFIFPTIAYLSSIGAIGLNQYRLNTIKQLQLEHEVKTAQLVQECFLRNETVSSHGVVIAGNVQPATECSGDWWGHFPICEKYYCVMLMDAVGHGAPAALMTALTSSYATIVAQTFVSDHWDISDPAKIMEQLNIMFSNALQNRYHMTGVIAIVDRVADKLHIANAGHATPYLMRFEQPNQTSTVKPLIGSANPIGIDVDTEFSTKTYDFLPQDCLVLYTDGIFEVSNAKKEVYGKRRFRLLLQMCQEKTASDIVDHILNDVGRFVGDELADDDMTVVVVERR